MAPKQLRTVVILHDGISSRLKTFVDHLGLTDRAFEESVKWSNGFYGKVRNGSTSFSVEKAMNIFTAYPQLNIAWLFTGKGDMILFKERHVKIENINDILKCLDQICENSDKNFLAVTIPAIKQKLMQLESDLEQKDTSIAKLKESQKNALKKIEELFGM